jgi:predicted acyltransferase
MQATLDIEAPEIVQPPVPRNFIASEVPRNVSVDAYRGLVMLLMMGEIMQFWAVAKAYPNSLFWHILAYNQTHVEWAGLGLHDMIQPSFTFLVGGAKFSPAIAAHPVAKLRAHRARHFPAIDAEPAD